MIHIHFDGGCEPINPGGVATYGFTIKHESMKPYHGFGVVGEGEGMTNNLAEYEGLLNALRSLNHMIEGGEIVPQLNEKVLINGDSKMVIYMCAGIWGRKNPHKKYPHLLVRLQTIKQIVAQLQNKYGLFFQLEWIPREENQEADDLCNLAFSTYQLNK